MYKEREPKRVGQNGHSTYGDQLFLIADRGCILTQPQCACHWKSMAAMLMWHGDRHFQEKMQDLRRVKHILRGVFHALDMPPWHGTERTRSSRVSL